MDAPKDKYTDTHEDKDHHSTRRATVVGILNGKVLFLKDLMLSLVPGYPSPSTQPSPAAPLAPSCSTPC